MTIPQMESRSPSLRQSWKIGNRVTAPIRNIIKPKVPVSSFLPGKSHLDMAYPVMEDVMMIPITDATAKNTLFKVYLAKLACFQAFI